MLRSPVSPIAVGLIASATLLAGCSLPGLDDKDDSRNTSRVQVEVRPGEVVTATSGGVSVTLPAESVTGTGSLVVEVGADVPAWSTRETMLSDAGPLISVSLDGASLTGPATIVSDVPEDWDPRLVPVIAWQDGSGSYQWLPTEESTTADGARVASAQAAHFSQGFLGGFDPRKAASAVFEKLKNTLVGRAGAQQPRCDDEDRAREQLEVTSDRGDAVKWCLGLQDGAPVLKVANNRNTWAQVSVPLTSTVISGDGWGFSTDDLVRLLGEGLSRFAEAFPDDRRILLLGAGDTITISVPTDETGGAQLSGSVSGYLLSIIGSAIDMFATISGAAGLKASTNAERFFDLLGSGAGTEQEWAGAALACLRSMADTFGTDLAEPPDGFEQLNKVMGFAARCGFEIGKASIDDSGPLAWLISATVATVVGVVELVWNLIEQLFVGAREVFDQVMYLFGSETDPDYDVRTDPTTSSSSLLGTTWYVHGGSLTINSDGTAESVGHGTCPDSDSTDWCNDVLEFAGSVTDTGMVLTVTNSSRHNETTGEDLPPHPDYGVPVGTVFTLERYHDDYLITQRYSPTGEHLYPDAANDLGNPYLCAPGTDDPEMLCGA